MGQEQTIQKSILDYLESKGCWAVKVIQANRRGCPDVIACMPDGRFLGIEVKTPTGSTSKIQDLQLARITGSGGVAITARSLDDVKRLF